MQLTVVLMSMDLFKRTRFNNTVNKSSATIKTYSGLMSVASCDEWGAFKLLSKRWFTFYSLQRRRKHTNPGKETSSKYVTMVPNMSSSLRPDATSLSLN